MRLTMNIFRKGLRLKFSILIRIMLMTALLGPTRALAAAETFTVSQKFPINIVVFVPCAAGGAGELVELTGDLHDLFHVTLTPNGGFRFSFVGNPQGVSGIGLTTGAMYQGTGITRDNFGGRVGSEETFINNFRIIGQGPGNNYLVHEKLHITIHPDGTVTSFHDNFSVECK
jgi:hypothetical protein